MFIILCALFLFFVGLNLEHTSDVSFGFHTFADIPVFLVAFSSFVIGMLFAIPFVISFGKRKKKSAKTSDTPSITDRANKESEHLIYGDSVNEESRSETKKDGIKKENSPYGID